MGENNRGYDDRNGSRNSLVETEELQVVIGDCHCKVGKACVQAK